MMDILFIEMDAPVISLKIDFYIFRYPGVKNGNLSLVN